MKKILLVGMLVISGLSFGRDFDYRGAKEFKAVEEVVVIDSNKMSRERDISEKNMDIYSDFHKELDTMSRGSEGR